MAKVAVLLAAYNGKQYIEEQLVSILSAGNDCDVDVYISVDDSVDGTYEFCKEISLKYTNVSVLDYGDVFGGAAKNFFRLFRDVDLSGYDYIALSDQDDIWLESKLSRAINILKSNNCDAYSSDVTAFWESGKEALVKKSYPQQQYDFFFEAAGPGCTYVLSNKAAAMFKEFLLNGWCEANEVALHDWLIYAFCRSRGLSWYIDDKPGMRYRQHGNNQVGFNSGMAAYMKRIQMVRNNWYRSQVEAIYSLINGKGSKNPFSRLYMIRKFYQLRRRRRDAYALLFMTMLGLY